MYAERNVLGDVVEGTYDDQTAVKEKVVDLFLMFHEETNATVDVQAALDL